MMVRYITTKKVCRASGSQIVYLEKDWNLRPNEYVNVCVKSAVVERPPVYSTKRICCVGTGQCIFLNKDWGFRLGELVTIIVKKRENFVPGTNSETDPEDQKVEENLEEEFSDEPEPW